MLIMTARYVKLINVACTFSLSNQSFYVHVQTCGCEWVSESEAWSVAKVSYIDLIDPDNWEETIATTSIASISSREDT